MFLKSVPCAPPESPRVLVARSRRLLCCVRLNQLSVGTDMSLGSAQTRGHGRSVIIPLVFTGTVGFHFASSAGLLGRFAHMCGCECVPADEHALITVFV